MLLQLRSINVTTVTLNKCYYNYAQSLLNSRVRETSCFKSQTIIFFLQNLTSKMHEKDGCNLYGPGHGPASERFALVM